MKDAASTAKLFDVLAKVNTPLKNEDLKVLQGKNLESLLADESIKTPLLGRMKTTLEFVQQSCVMSRFPLYHIDRHPDRINPSKPALIPDPKRYLLYTQDELRSAVTEHVEKVKEDLKLDDFRALPEMAEFGLDGPKQVFSRLKMLDEENPDPAKIPIAVLDMVVANLETLSEAIKNGSLRIKHGNFKLQKDSRYYYYEGPEKSPSEAISSKDLIGT